MEKIEKIRDGAIYQYNNHQKLISYHWTSRIVVVAILNEELGEENGHSEWAAYIGVIQPKQNLENELDRVARRGTKILPGIAKVLFPDVKNKVYRR